IELLQDPARAQALGRRGHERVKQTFSCTAQLERTEALYNQLLAARTRKHADEQRNTFARRDATQRGTTE
ncbi:MAG TPA: hypothetical protein VE821_08030, partial [Pyrinomonadaceae bacterium]|nr:hypothetical protein [Pyrinomonadaceae bacterium]